MIIIYTLLSLWIVISNPDTYLHQVSRLSSADALLFTDTCAWIGATTGDWSTAANWSCGHVPLPTDDVVITNAMVTLDVSPVVNNLNVTRSSGYVIEGPGRLTVNGAFNILGNINNSGVSPSMGL